MKAEIKFRIKATTQMNQSIRVLGDTPALGNWSPVHAVQLYTNERHYPYWFTTHFIRIPMGERFDFKFALFEHDTLKFWENLPGNRNRRYTPTYGRVHLKGVFGELDGDEIIEKRLPSFSNMPVQIHPDTVRRLKLSRLKLKTDNSMDSSNVSDESSIFSEWHCIHSNDYSIDESEEIKSPDCFDSFDGMGKQDPFTRSDIVIHVELSPHFISDATGNSKKLTALQKIKTAVDANLCSSGLQNSYVKRKETNSLFKSGRLLQKEKRSYGSLGGERTETDGQRNPVECQDSEGVFMQSHAKKLKRIRLDLEMLEENVNKPDFQKISKIALTKRNKLIIFGLEGIFFHDSKSQRTKPSDDLLEELEFLASDPTCSVFLNSGLTLSSLPSCFFDLENIGMVAEHGFLHKGPQDFSWQRLFEMDWSWKEVVSKIMEAYVLKAPGSRVDIKESCVGWEFDSQCQSGNEQSERLMRQLNETLENNGEIEVVRGERGVEVRPTGMNKGTAAQMIAENQAEELGKIDMVVTVSAGIDDEDMVMAVEEMMKEEQQIFADDLDVFHFMTGNSSTLADYLLQGEDDLFRLIESLSE